MFAGMFSFGVHVLFLPEGSHGVGSLWVCSFSFFLLRFFFFFLAWKFWLWGFELLVLCFCFGHLYNIFLPWGFMHSVVNWVVFW